MYEKYIYKLVCPGGHDVIIDDEGDYYCPTCGCAYRKEKLIQVPVDNTRSNYHPTVYGHPN